MAQANRALLYPLAVIATILVGWVLYVGADILKPIVIALLMVALLSPLVRLLARIHIPPFASVLGVLTLVFYGVFQLIITGQENIEAFLRDTPPLAGEETPEVGARRRPQKANPSDPRRADPTLAESSPSVSSQQILQDPVDDPEWVPSPEIPPILPAETSATETLAQAADPSAQGSAAIENSTGVPSMADPGAPAFGEVQTHSAGQPSEEEEGNPLLDPQASQTLAIEQAGGLASIIDKLVVRIEKLALPDPVINYLSQELTDLKSDDRARRLAQQFLGGGLTLTRTLILIFFYMLFIFAEQAVFRRKILSVAGNRREDAARVLDTIGKGMQRFLGIKTLISLSTGASAYPVLVYLEIPYALLFATITFLFNFLPYFGSIFAGTLPTVVALAISPTLDKAIIVAIWYIAINTLYGTYLEPKIMGRQLDLSPLVIIISVVVWGSLWGVVGAFLCVPLTASLQIILSASDSTRPIAILLSSGPSADSPRGLKRLANALPGQRIRRAGP